MNQIAIPLSLASAFGVGLGFVLMQFGWRWMQPWPFVNNANRELVDE